MRWDSLKWYFFHIWKELHRIFYHLRDSYIMVIKYLCHCCFYWNYKNFCWSSWAGIRLNHVPFNTFWFLYSKTEVISDLQLIFGLRSLNRTSNSKSTFFMYCVIFINYFVTLFNVSRKKNFFLYKFFYNIK